LSLPLNPKSQRVTKDLPVRSTQNGQRPAAQIASELLPIQQSTINNQQSTINNHQSSIINHQSSIINRQSSIVNQTLFLHGCFWHGHEHCPAFRLPKSRRPTSPSSAGV